MNCTKLIKLLLWESINKDRLFHLLNVTKLLFISTPFSIASWKSFWFIHWKFLMSLYSTIKFYETHIHFWDRQWSGLASTGAGREFCLIDFRPQSTGFANFIKFTLGTSSIVWSSSLRAVFSLFNSSCHLGAGSTFILPSTTYPFRRKRDNEATRGPRN